MLPYHACMVHGDGDRKGGNLCLLLIRLDDSVDLYCGKLIEGERELVQIR